MPRGCPWSLSRSPHVAPAFSLVRTCQHCPRPRRPVDRAAIRHLGRLLLLRNTAPHVVCDPEGPAPPVPVLVGSAADDRLRNNVAPHALPYPHREQWAESSRALRTRRTRRARRGRRSGGSRVRCTRRGAVEHGRRGARERHRILSAPLLFREPLECSIGARLPSRSFIVLRHEGLPRRDCRRLPSKERHRAARQLRWPHRRRAACRSPRRPSPRDARTAL